MSDVFHVHTGVHRQTVKASLPRGQGEVRYKALMPNEATTPRLQPWAVVYDPSETLRTSRFTKMDIMFGVEYGCWEHGTLFQHLVLGHYLYFDKKEGRVRRLKEDVDFERDDKDAILFFGLSLGYHLYFDNKKGRVRSLKEIIPAEKKILDGFRRK